ncbi:MAG: DUF2085 domain-containing protein [Sphaerobacter sp.]|nr:DUF2085 domain-containing protein [Sphaerobacter sp.]
MEHPSHTAAPRQERLIIAVDRAMYHVARHWLWLLNGAGALLVLLAILAPLLNAAGHSTAARAIYRIFSLVCHQRPDRSFVLAGEPLAYCQRDAAIYGGLLVAGLLYAPLRQRIRPAGLGVAAALAAPMALDGLTQLVGLRESTAALRVTTGALFALGVAWVVFPRLAEGFAEIEQTLWVRFDRLAREGRARPLAPHPRREERFG